MSPWVPAVLNWPVGLRLEGGPLGSARPRRVDHASWRQGHAQLLPSWLCLSTPGDQGHTVAADTVIFPRAAALLVPKPHPLEARASLAKQKNRGMAWP